MKTRDVLVLGMLRTAAARVGDPDMADRYLAGARAEGLRIEEDSAMTDLRNISNEQLLAELERRKEEEERTAPRPVPHPNFNSLVKTVIFGVEEVVKSGYQDEDFKHYVYEAAIQAVYGDSFWDWKRKKGI